MEGPSHHTSKCRRFSCIGFEARRFSTTTSCKPPETKVSFFKRSEGDRAEEGRVGNVRPPAKEGL